MIEDRLASAAQRGELLDLSEVADRSIDAAVIRDLVRGRHENLDPRGVRLHGAVVTGELDLTDLRTEIPLQLTSCEFEEPITLHRAHLVFLDLSGSTIPAIYADSLRCEHDVLASEVRCPGGIDLTDADVGGGLFLDGARLANPDGAALDADRLHVAGFLRLNDGFHARSDHELAAVRMYGAYIDGQFDLSGAHLINTAGSAFGADQIVVGRSLLLTGAFRASSSGANDTIRLRGAHIRGQLSCRGGRVSNTDGPAFCADGAVVDGDVLFVGGFRAETASELGSVRLPGARIAGELRFEGAQLHNKSGPAFEADRILVGGNAAFVDGFRAEGAGAVRMPSARIAGQLAFNGAELISRDGTALLLHSANVEGHAFLGRGLRAEAICDGPAVDLAGANFRRQLSFADGEIVQHTADELALDLSNVTVDEVLFLPLSEVPGEQLIDVDGLRYREVPWSASLDEWLTVLRKRTPAYLAQPYQQLAAVYRAAGHEREARRILMAQQRDLRRRADVGGPIRRALHFLSGKLIGYGHQSWRALAALLTVVGLALVLTFGASAQGASAHPGDRPAGPCTLVENVGFAVDLAIPLIKTGGGQRCEFITNTTAGQWYLAGGWLTQLLGWSFATLFVAGFTGLVRKT